MVVKQVSVLLPNVPATLSKLTDVLDNEGISAKAIVSAGTAEKSKVRLVVNDPDRAAAVLSTFGYEYELTDVLAAKVPVHPAGMNAILKPLSAAGINILYLYTTINRLGPETIVILGVDKIDMAARVLTQNWISLLGDEVYSL